MYITLGSFYWSLHYDPLTVNGTVHSIYQEAAEARGLLDNNSEGELCFTEARDYGYSPQQLRGLLVTLTMEGAPAKAILESHQGIHAADFQEHGVSPETAWNSCLRTDLKPWDRP